MRVTASASTRGQSGARMVLASLGLIGAAVLWLGFSALMHWVSRE